MDEKSRAGQKTCHSRGAGKPPREGPEHEGEKRGLPRRLWSIFSGALVGAVVLLALLLVGVRLFGFTPYAILSGSMSPVYQVGDLVYVAKTDPGKIQKGDVITFVSDSALEVVTHRVADVDKKERSFATKGDANQTIDGQRIAYENVLGVVKFSIPKLGLLSGYLKSPSGRYAGIAAGLLLLLVLLILPELFHLKKKERQKQNL